jgi:hypothetical protein
MVVQNVTALGLDTLTFKPCQGYLLYLIEFSSKLGLNL